MTYRTLNEELTAKACIKEIVDKVSNNKMSIDEANYYIKELKLTEEEVRQIEEGIFDSGKRLVKRGQRFFTTDKDKKKKLTKDIVTSYASEAGRKSAGQTKIAGKEIGSLTKELESLKTQLENKKAEMEENMRSGQKLAAINNNKEIKAIEARISSIEGVGGEGGKIAKAKEVAKTVGMGYEEKASQKAFRDLVISDTKGLIADLKQALKSKDFNEFKTEVTNALLQADSLKKLSSTKDVVSAIARKAEEE